MKLLPITVSICLTLAILPGWAQESPNAGLSSTPDSETVAALSPETGRSRLLRAGVQEDDLTGGSSDEAKSGQARTSPTQAPSALVVPPPLAGAEATTAPARTPIRLSAEQSADPDRGNKEVMLAWDKWRNRFAHGVWERYCETIDGPGTMFIGSMPLKVGNAPGLQFPNGLVVTYACVVNYDHQISGAHIVRSSGDPNLDDIVMQSVMAMAGKKSLNFPKGSLRRAVYEQESLGTGPNGWQGRTYNDVERYARAR